MIERIIDRPENNIFIGDEVDMIVNVLKNEDSSEQGCYIDEVIVKERAVVFFS